MNQASYNNYLATIQCCYASLASKVIDDMRIDDCKTKEDTITLKIFSAMFDTLKCWKWQTSTDYINNPQSCLSPEYIECIQNFLNKICNRI